MKKFLKTLFTPSPKRAAKKYAAFISFAKPDEAIASALNAVFDRVDLATFFSRESLPKGGSPEWQTEIQKAIGRSSCFVPIITNSSISRSWVLYETGSADAQGLKKVISRVDGVRRKEILQIPDSDKQYYDLYSEKSIAYMVNSVGEEHFGTDWRKKNEKRITKSLLGSPEVAELVRLARQRWVFIAGSRPASDPYEPRIALQHEPGLPGEAVLERVVADLTKALLDVGFGIITCPAVPYVGRSAMRAALDSLSDEPPPVTSRLRFGGLNFRFEDPAYYEHLRELRWHYRENYLSTAEVLLVLGGNEGTREEASVARELGLRVCAIPFLLGEGERIQETHDGSIRSLEADTSLWHEAVCRRIVETIVRTDTSR